MDDLAMDDLAMTDVALRRIGALIARHSGLQVRDQDYGSLEEKVWRRAKSLRLNSLEDYYARLLEGDRCEWQELYSILTVNESYFLRDANQFRLLSERLLPEILARKRAAAPPGTRPQLRIWSAGCSTGEELYSLAIALDRLDFPWLEWDTRLVGTDLSATAIHRAQRGVYSNWSFRQVPAEIQRHYFQANPPLYSICDRLRQRVSFVCGNLLSDPCPHPAIGLCEIDLIVCRNVFIYLDSQAIGQILGKFHAALAPQGYLLTGHTELYSQDTSSFTVLSLPESVVYQKPVRPQRQAAVAPSPAPIPRPRAAVRRSPPQPLAASTDLAHALDEAQTLLRQQAYGRAIQRAEAIVRGHPRCDAARRIAAQGYANTGQYAAAEQLCHQILRHQPLHVDTHYLLAQIAEDRNDWESAKQHLRKILYLEADFVRAYLDLASIHERDQQPDKADKLRRQALMRLAKLPPETVLDDDDGTTVAQWQARLSRCLGDHPPLSDSAGSAVANA